MQEYYFLRTAIGYAVYDTFEELEVGLDKLVELGFEINELTLVMVEE